MEQDIGEHLRAYLSQLDTSIGPDHDAAEAEDKNLDDNGWILNLDNHGKTAPAYTTTDRILVDSGAVAHVCPPSWATGCSVDIPGTNRGFFQQVASTSRTAEIVRYDSRWQAQKVSQNASSMSVTSAVPS